MTGKKPYITPAVRRLGKIGDVQKSSDDPAVKQAAEDLDEQGKPQSGNRRMG